MTGAKLVEALTADLREVVKDYELIAELQSAKPVSVYAQYIPRAEFESDSYYPLVEVSLRAIEFEDEGKGRFNAFRVATILITIGVFTDFESDGWQDLFSIAERIMQFLSVTPIVGKHFTLYSMPEFEPLPMQPIDQDQPQPFMFGSILVRYAIGTDRF